MSWCKHGYKPIYKKDKIIDVRSFGSLANKKARGKSSMENLTTD
jgi:hypothetical protein